MLNKTKKIAFLTSGLAGALVVSSAVGVALSSCSTTNTSNSDTSIKYTYSIDWTDQNQVKQLTIDEQGLVYSSANKSEIIAVAPNTAATSFVIPASVKYITGYNQITKNSDGTIASSTAKGAFQDSISLISVTFASDNTLVSIGDSSFSGCTYLSTINLPSSTSVVYNNAFANCTNLRSINLVGVSYIGSAAFQNAMVNGAGVSIDLSSATYIGDNAFSGSKSLVGVDFSKNTTLSYIGISAFANALVNGDKVATLDLSKATTLKTISDSAFSGCTNLGSVVLPSSSALTTIGANAFSGATNLTQVGSAANTFNAPSTLGNYVLTQVTSSSTSYVSSGIGINAFSGTKITTIDLSAVASTTPFANAAFKNMTALTSVNFGSTSKITTIPYSLFEGDTALASLTLPSSITTIQDGTNNSTASSDEKSPFYGCTALKTVDMSAITSYNTGTTTWYGVTIDKTTAVPYALFKGLTGLTTVALKKGTTVISSDAFSGASALTSVREGSISTAADATDGLIISSTLEMINGGAFLGTGIKSVAFADTSTNAANKLWFVGKSSFANTTALASVDLTAADTTTVHSGVKEGAIFGSNTSNLVNLTGLSAISESAFSGATALTDVKLPTSITGIYLNAFANNAALATINFNELTKLTSIGTGNFTGANALASIDLGNTAMTSSTIAVANIFTGLPTTATVTLPSTATNLDNTSFLTGTNTTASVAARPTITYGGTNGATGLNLAIDKSVVSVFGTSTNIGSLGSGNSNSAGNFVNTMLKYISGDYDLTKSVNTASSTSSLVSTGKDVGYYFAYSFFGNTKLTSLTMSASNFALGGNTAAQATQATKLFFNNVSSAVQTTDYAYNKIPFGNNSALKSFTFTNFDSNSSATIPSGANNPLYKTTTKTWAQVATIINKFASNNVNAPTAWPSVSGTNQDSNTKVNVDSSITGAQGTSDTSKYNLTINNINIYNANDGSEGAVQASHVYTVDNSIAENADKEKVDVTIFYHNGVKWTLSVYATDHATNPGAITLVGENVNVYKATDSNASNANMYCFNQGTSGSSSSKITVTLNILPSTKASA